MRVWRSFGSEHSMNLMLIGRFESVSGAEAAVERMKVLRELAEAEWSDDDWRRPSERMPSRIVDELTKLKLYDMGRYDVDIYAFDHTVERKGSSVHVWTEESEVQGFLKLLIDLGARVEVFSRHHWNEDGTPRTHEGGTPPVDEGGAPVDEGGPSEVDAGGAPVDEGGPSEADAGGTPRPGEEG